MTEGLWGPKKKRAHTRVAGEPSVSCLLGSGGEAATATAAPGGVGVVEGKAGALHRRNVVDGYSHQVLSAEPVDEQPDGVHLQNEVIIVGLVLDAQAVFASSRREGR